MDILVIEPLQTCAQKLESDQLATNGEVTHIRVQISCV